MGRIAAGVYRSIRVSTRISTTANAVTSHSSQGQTSDRVLIHIDTELGAKDRLNDHMAYVAVSRRAQDAQIFTSDRQQLSQVLSREVSHQSAGSPEVRLEEKQGK